MADIATTKKVTDLAENTDITDEDLFIAGSAGTASLRKVKWSNVWAKIMASILNKISANNLITTTAGYLLDARQGKALDDKISELNTNKITKGDDDVLYINGKVLPMSKGIGELPVYSMHLMWHKTDGWCVVIYFMYNNESYYGRAKLTDVVKK